MDLLLQVSEKELEEFPEPSVDNTDQDKPERINTGGTQSSNISHQLQKVFQSLNSFIQSKTQVQETSNVTGAQQLATGKETGNVTSNVTGNVTSRVTSHLAHIHI